jgi:hypothetical protein
MDAACVGAHPGDFARQSRALLITSPTGAKIAGNLASTCRRPINRRIHDARRRLMGNATFVQEHRESGAGGKVSIELMDPAKDRPIKVWRFRDQSVISIGRSPDCNVEISDLYVSRLHAEIHSLCGRWMLRSLGRNGVLVHGHPIKEMEFDENLTFRLGGSGPTLRFRGDGEANDFGATIGYDAVQAEMFRLDVGELVRQVQEVSAAPYFDRLQEAAKRIKQRREAN